MFGEVIWQKPSFRGRLMEALGRSEGLDGKREVRFDVG
jgi:hypothetical protein